LEAVLSPHPARGGLADGAVRAHRFTRNEAARAPEPSGEDSRARVLAVIGTRPEAIKMFSPVAALRAREDLFETVVCSSGQHDELLTDALRTFEFQADECFAAMRHDQHPADLLWTVGRWLTDVCRRRRPDIVLVQGDTATAMAAGLAAFYNSAVVGHVEAGLRTYDNAAPWPEEANRRILGALADVHFAPSALAEANLRREGVAPEQVHVTGNTGIDALHWALVRSAGRAAQNDDARRTVLVTAHRRESIPEGVDSIVRSVRCLAQRYPEVRFLFVMHPAPAIRRSVVDALGYERPPNIELRPPCDYLEFVRLLADSFMVLTDSGGIQEEAPVLGKPVLVVNPRTARQEPLEAGTARIVGTAERDIVAAAAQLLDDPEHHARMASRHDPYGDGHAGERIAAVLEAIAGSLGKGAAARAGALD
jgi:UDP-N-acetylglucosamine 2-epimerase (non-hydrolysing)